MYVQPTKSALPQAMFFSALAIGGITYHVMKGSGPYSIAFTTLATIAAAYSCDLCRKAPPQRKQRKIETISQDSPDPIKLAFTRHKNRTKKNGPTHS